MSNYNQSFKLQNYRIFMQVTLMPNDGLEKMEIIGDVTICNRTGSMESELIVEQLSNGSYWNQQTINKVAESIKLLYPAIDGMILITYHKELSIQ